MMVVVIVEKLKRLFVVGILLGSSSLGIVFVFVGEKRVFCVFMSVIMIKSSYILF